MDEITMRDVIEGIQKMYEQNFGESFSSSSISKTFNMYKSYIVEFFRSLRQE